MRGLLFLAALFLPIGILAPAGAAPVDDGVIPVGHGARDSNAAMAPAAWPAPAESGRPVALTQPVTAIFTAVSGADRASSIECLSAAIAYEAGHESQAGKQAVAQVVLNRARHRAFPKSVCGVVYQGSGRRTGCQFTFTCDGSLRRILPRRVLASARAVAVAAVDGELPPTVGRATHYHADYVSPRWAPAMARIGQIGAHIFYAFPGHRGVQGGFVPGSTADPAPTRATATHRRQPAFTAWGLVPAAPATIVDSTDPAAY